MKFIEIQFLQFQTSWVMVQPNDKYGIVSDGLKNYSSKRNSL